MFRIDGEVIAQISTKRIKILFQRRSIFRARQSHHPFLMKLRMTSMTLRQEKAPALMVSHPR